LSAPSTEFGSIQERGHLLTEQVNPSSLHLDQLSPLEIVDLFNQEDAQVLAAIAGAREALAQALEKTAASLRAGGRLFYIGAGTSGRLGVLDAAECPPTFCTPPELVQGILAGGTGAMFKSSEAMEDRREDGAQALIDYGITAQDVLVGITAGGTTPYVQGALAAAKAQGTTTIFMACVPADQVPLDVDVDIRLLVGPEVLAGSTRLKAGTVTKLALNILSTGTMVLLGKVYGNRMVDVAVTNQKLYGRAVRMIQDLTDLSREDAVDLLEKSDRCVKLALLTYWTGLTATEGEQRLELAQGNLRQAVQNWKNA
jgi:N-acetylmuramic acid 6-phosphate etherase